MLSRALRLLFWISILSGEVFASESYSSESHPSKVYSLRPNRQCTPSTQPSSRRISGHHFYPRHVENISLKNYLDEPSPKFSDYDALDLYFTEGSWALLAEKDSGPEKRSSLAMDYHRIDMLAKSGPEKAEEAKDRLTKLLEGKDVKSVLLNVFKLKAYGLYMLLDHQQLPTNHATQAMEAFIPNQRIDDVCLTHLAENDWNLAAELAISHCRPHLLAAAIEHGVTINDALLDKLLKIGYHDTAPKKARMIYDTVFEACDDEAKLKEIAHKACELKKFILLESLGHFFTINGYQLLPETVALAAKDENFLDELASYFRIAFSSEEKLQTLDIIVNDKSSKPEVKDKAKAVRMLVSRGFAFDWEVPNELIMLHKLITLGIGYEDLGVGWQE